MANFGAGGGSFGGSSAGSAYLRLTLDTAGYQAKLNSAQTQTVKAVSGMGTQFQQLQKFAKGALASFAAVEVIRRSIVAYDEQAKAVARLNIAFGNSPALIGVTTDAFIEQASALSKLTGVQDENIIGAQAALTVFGLTEDQLRRITPLVLDYAAFTGTDVTSAAQSMGRAVLGNARALKTIGIDFQRTGNRASDFEAIMQQVGDRVGGTAEAIATPMDHMRVAMDEAFESIGSYLAPALKGLGSILGTLPAPVTALGIAFALIATRGKEAAMTFARWLPMILAVTEGLAILGDTLDEDTTFLDAIGNELERVVGLLGVDVSNSPISGMLKDLAESGSDLPIAEGLRDAMAAAEGYADATAQATSETLALISAQYQLAGGMLGLVESFNSSKDATADLKEARAELNALTAQGKQGTDEYKAAQDALKDAQINAVQSQLALEGAVVSYQQKLADGEVSREQAIADLRAMGSRAGLTKGEVDALISSILRIPDESHTNITVENQQAIAAIAATINSLAAIPAYKTVSIAVVGGTSFGGQIALAEGGIIKGAAGFITRGPTMIRPNVMVGEGRGPGGYSPEAVIPLNDHGKGILREVFSEVMGSQSTINVNGYAGDPERLADYIVRRMARSA